MLGEGRRGILFSVVAYPSLVFHLPLKAEKMYLSGAEGGASPRSILKTDKSHMCLYSFVGAKGGREYERMLEGPVRLTKTCDLVFEGAR